MNTGRMERQSMFEFKLKGVCLRPMAKNILYFAGCTTRARYSEDIESHLDLLRKLGFSVKTLEDECCCGDPLILSGDTENALKVAQKNAQAFNSAKVDLIATECAGCYRVLAHEYPEFGLKMPKVQHMSQVIAENLGKLKLKDEAKKEKVAYHDPCELGRLGGEYDAPRKVIARLAELVEPQATKEESRCCGAGGAMFAIEPEFSVKLAENRIRKDIEPLGVTKLITACPSCVFNLTVGASRRGAETGKDIEVFDLSTYLYQKLREEK
jgi:heterodisulfide reductase subunit D